VQEWRGSEKRAKSLADALGAKDGKLFLAERVEASPAESAGAGEDRSR
jgi:hypothetical protein